MEVRQEARIEEPVQERCVGGRGLVALTRAGEKAVGSTEGMILTAKTSPYYAGWLEYAPRLYERTHRYTFGTKPVTAEHVAISYPVLLRKAGYRTGFVGKFGVGVPPGGAKQMFDSFTPLDRTPYWKKHLSEARRV